MGLGGEESALVGPLQIQNGDEVLRETMTAACVASELKIEVLATENQFPGFIASHDARWKQPFRKASQQAPTTAQSTKPCLVVRKHT